jgi:hypothetical protein
LLLRVELSGQVLRSQGKALNSVTDKAGGGIEETLIGSKAL